MIHTRFKNSDLYGQDLSEINIADNHLSRSWNLAVGALDIQNSLLIAEI